MDLARVPPPKSRARSACPCIRRWPEGIRFPGRSGAEESIDVPVPPSFVPNASRLRCRGAWAPPPALHTSRLPRSPAPSAPIPAFLGSSDWFAMPIPRRRDRSRSACLASRQGLPLLSVWQVGKFGCSSPGCCAPIELQRLLKPLVQERNGPLPGKASSLGVILGAILLEEPMFGPWIRIDGDWPSLSLQLLLHLCNRLSRLERVILREVEEVCGRSSAIVQSGVGAIKDHDGGDLLGHSDGHVERVGVSQREANEGELTAPSRQMRRIGLVHDPHSRRAVAAPPQSRRPSCPQASMLVQLTVLLISSFTGRRSR